MMCFYNDDYDWIASVILITEGPAKTATKCYECGGSIAAGQWRRHIYQQEHEECRICEDSWSDEYIDAEDMAAQVAIDDTQESHDFAQKQLDILAKHDCQYGETFACDCCESCAKLLLSIEEHERLAGCPPSARQPSVGGLWDELYEHHDGPTYAREAMETWPELRSWERLAELVGSDE